MEEKNPGLETLKDIRSIMERSTRFLSLSGLSGVFAGTFALAGAIAAYVYLHLNFWSTNYYTYAYNVIGEPDVSFMRFFFFDAGVVLLSSLAVCMFLTYRNAIKQDVPFWNPVSRRMAVHLLIPLFAGGIFCLLLLQHRQIGLIAPSMLLFYGMALLNASKFTHDDIRTLGILEITLGLISAYFIGYGLLFWAVGFGLLHIIYGIMMYKKYEKDI